MKSKEVKEKQPSDASFFKVGLEFAGHIGHDIDFDFEFFSCGENDDSSDSGQNSETDDPDAGHHWNTVPEIDE